MARAFIGIGSNIGDRKQHIDLAIDELQKLGEVEAVSVIIETKPEGYLEQPLFFNGVAIIDTALSPVGLLDALQEIEHKLGRVRTVRWGPRTIDLDIVFYDDLVLESERLTIPHPRMHERVFVLEPLCEIAPDTIHPVLGKSVRELLKEVQSDDS